MSKELYFEFYSTGSDFKFAFGSKKLPCRPSRNGPPSRKRDKDARRLAWGLEITEFGLV